jgi:hypothetical protein
MDRMMVEHLLRCGYYNTAVKLARQSGIEVSPPCSLRVCVGAVQSQMRFT